MFLRGTNNVIHWKKERKKERNKETKEMSSMVQLLSFWSLSICRKRKEEHSFIAERQCVKSWKLRIHARLYGWEFHAFLFLSSLLYFFSLQRVNLDSLINKSPWLEMFTRHTWSSNSRTMIYQTQILFQFYFISLQGQSLGLFLALLKQAGQVVFVQSELGQQEGRQVASETLSGKPLCT